MLKNIYSRFTTAAWNNLVIVAVLLVAGLSTACEEELPTTGSLVDKTPPTANFTVKQGTSNYREVTVSNLSTNATDYVWDFGDGFTTTAKDTVHTYAADGKFTIKLTASDKLGADSVMTVEVDLVDVTPPAAAFSISQSPTNYLEIKCVNASTNVDTYAWDFGDGTTSTEQSPTHVYTADKTYTVTLVAKDVYNKSSTATNDVIIEKPLDTTPPFADFTFAASGTKVTFTNASLNVVTYAWDFGDGASSTDTDPVHTFAAAGTYTVKLVATDDVAATATVSKTVTVVDFEPVIKNPSFDDPGSDSKYNEDWDSRSYGGKGIIQITTSPVYDGGRAAKFPAAGDRDGYQVIEVLANTDYTVKFYYTLKTDAVGSITVAVLGDGTTDLKGATGANAGIINSVTVNDQTDANVYVEATLTFNSGNNSQIAIHITNTGAEARVDGFSIN
jgi:PKD repeat protein